MRCLAIMVDIADSATIDNVILWDDDGRTVATAYMDGQVKMVRPLEATTFDGCIAEVREVWHIPFGRVARIQEWVQVP